MKIFGTLTVAAVLAAGTAGCQSTVPMGTSGAVAQPSIADHAEDVRPLKIGAHAPGVTLRRSDGQAVELSSLYSVKPSILIFYRGGWCPYCNKHLGQIAQAEQDLVKLGYQVLAISPDRPESLQATLNKDAYVYQLLSDSDMKLARAFGLAFHVDDATVEKYHGYGINLDEASGRGHHLLPVPAVYIVDTRGVIRFAHWNPDYKTRLGPEELLDAARGAIRAKE